MPHLTLLEIPVVLPGTGAEAPVGRHEEEEIGTSAVALANLKDRLLGRDVVAAVAIDEDDPSESVNEETLDEVVEKIEVDPWRGRDGAGEVEVMVRIAEPLERREEDAIGHPRRHAGDDLPEEKAVGDHGEMMPVLLDRRHRDHHRGVFGEGRHLGPGHLDEVHDRARV